METEFSNQRKILYIIAFVIFAISTYVVFKDVLFSSTTNKDEPKPDQNLGIAFKPPIVGDVSQSGVIRLYSASGDEEIYSLNDEKGQVKYILKSENIDLSLSSGSTVEILGRINGKLDDVTIIEVTTVKFK